METLCVCALHLEYATRSHVTVVSGINSSENSLPGTSVRIFMTYVSASSKLPYKCLLVWVLPQQRTLIRADMICPLP